MRRRMLMVVVVALLLVAGGAQAALADQGQGAIQFRGRLTGVEEGQDMYAVAELPGGRLKIVNPDGTWATLEVTSKDSAAAESLSGWYQLYDIEGIFQPGGAIPHSGRWQLWLSAPLVDPGTGFAGPPAGEEPGLWSGTYRAIVQVDETGWLNAQHTYHGVGSGAWEGWTVTMNSSFKKGDVFGARFSGHITPPRPRGRAR
jgi:hypothetical protein